MEVLEKTWSRWRTRLVRTKLEHRQEIRTVCNVEVTGFLSVTRSLTSCPLSTGSEEFRFKRIMMN